MPQGDFIPSRGAEYANWQGNVFARLDADPAAYGQTVESIAPYGVAYQAFVAAALL
ncbi:MAG: hypothetical protein AAGH92_07690 [Planctomycetota bacterium]